MDSRITHIRLKAALGCLADIMLPRTCCVCGRDLTPFEKAVCLPCLCDIPQTHFWQSRRNPMADKFNAAAAPYAEGEKYAFAAALYFFKDGSPYADISRKLKYLGNFSAGRTFGQMLGERMAGAEHLRDIDMIIPVPLHPLRKWKRGFNQAAVIANALAEAYGRVLGAAEGALGSAESALCGAGCGSAPGGGRALGAAEGALRGADCGGAAEGALRGADCGGAAEGALCGADCGSAPPVREDILRRVRRTATQTKLGAAAKRANVSGAFAVSRKFLLRAPKEPLPRHVLLVDDVFTTGATLADCFRALRTVFPPEVRISVATLACVQED